VAVAGGRITAIGAALDDAAESIDARGLIILPGLVDGHVHFNEPGRTDWEGWEAGTRGAAAGGVTTVCEMPLNAHPPTTTAAAFDVKLAAATRSALVDFGLWGGLVGTAVEHLPQLRERGVVAFKAFMCDSGIEDFPRVPDDLEPNLAAVARVGAVLGVHAESHEMTVILGQQLRAAGRADRPAWTLSRPPAAELEAIGRLLRAARATAGGGGRARVHVVHVSTADGLAKVAAARGSGLPATAETCPHYLWFTQDDFERIGPALKCAPPVRDAANRERLWRAVVGGSVDAIGSDHSPCPAAMKHTPDIWQVWSGVSGIQATLPVLLTEGVQRRGLSWERLAGLTATAPARLYGLAPKKGAIAVGADADFALVDPDRTWSFTAAHLQTKSGISPYLDVTFRGAVVRTIVRGRTVFVDGEITGTPGYGTFIPRGADAH